MHRQRYFQRFTKSFYGHLLYTGLWIMLLSLALVACDSRDETPSPPATSPAATATSAPRPTATPQPTATPSPTPPPQPAVEAIEQAVDEEGQIVVSRVYAPDGGWLVIYADDEGQPGALLGQASLAPGEQRNLVITVDPYLVTSVVHLRLHADTGEAETFDYPDADEPIELDGEPVGATVDIDVRVSAPAITVSDQVLERDGQLLIDAVTAVVPGWVAVHADDEGQPGALLGLSPVPIGESSDVAVGLNWRDVTRRLHAVLYADGGEAGVFQAGEEGEDTIVTVSGQPVTASFTVQAPPDVYVLNQPIVAAEVVVERAFINEAGWIVVYSNFEGFTDRLLGFAPLEAGQNTRITVPIDPANSTDILHILLHEDGGVQGQFDNPVDDPPLRDEEGRPLFFTFETDTGNYVITRNQPLSAENTVEAPLVVSDLDTWVVIWNDEDGAPGEILGQTLVERGVRRDVQVEIDVEAVTPTLWVVLHQDNGALGEFDYPGADEILLREREPIQAPFTVAIGE